MRRTSIIRALLLSCLLALAASGTASAATLTQEGGTWVYRAAPGESNALHVRPDEQAGGGVLFTEETVAVNLPGECYREDWDDETDARCPYGSGLRIELGDADDRVYISEDLQAGQAVVVDGGPGNDRFSGPLGGVAVTFLGGDGDDHLDGGDLGDVLDGGPGNDKIEGDGGNDVVRGGDGSDKVSGDAGADQIDGGAGWDLADGDWIDNSNNSTVTITLDGVADDGLPGEGDNVVAVEEFAVNRAGNFRAGADAVRVRFDNHGAASSNVVGSPGDDNIRTYDYADTIDGGAGNDTIEGGHGDDTITGGPGRDTINAAPGSGSCNFLVCRGGSGNDTILVRDGEQDSVTCGGGTDRVVADAIDTIAGDCEAVERPAVEQTPPPVPQRRGDDTRAPSRRGGGGGRGGRSAKRCVVPKVKAGARLPAVKRALARRGCKAKVKRVRSRKVAKGRAIKLSARAGRKLARGKTVTIVVSKGR
jgi:Ca2+-binding RTX toxin-like protein